MVTKLRAIAVIAYLVCLSVTAAILTRYMPWIDALTLAIAFEIPLAFTLAFLVHWVE